MKEKTHSEEYTIDDDEGVYVKPLKVHMIRR